MTEKKTRVFDIRSPALKPGAKLVIRGPAAKKTTKTIGRTTVKYGMLGKKIRAQP